jgi:hypothetical protein
MLPPIFRPNVHHDGSHVVYVVSETDTKTIEECADLWLVSIASGAAFHVGASR